jgi:hypothetical protein
MSQIFNSNMYLQKILGPNKFNNWKNVHIMCSLKGNEIDKMIRQSIHIHNAIYKHALEYIMLWKH